MAAQTLVDAAAKSLRIGYQPFLSSTRTRQLTSILQSSLPYTFVPVNDTFLTFTQHAQIILISRGGKPFAPVEKRSSIDSRVYRDIRERDWTESSEQYQKFLSRWNEVEKEIPALVKTLQEHFSDQVIQKEEFRRPLKALKAAGVVENIDQLRQTIQSYRSLRREQLFLYPILKKTEAPLKVSAHSNFDLSQLQTREYVLEHHRDRLDLFRLELEKRFRGMALVRHPDIAEPKPWILMPEDPIASWGADFSERTEELIRLARYRFLLTEEEKEVEMDREAREALQEGFSGIRRMQGRIDIEKTLQQVKAQLRQDKARMFRNDRQQLYLPGNVGELGPQFSKNPITREDLAVYETSDRQLVKSGAWRVAD